jgi:nicotinamide riboside transporter PnuC
VERTREERLAAVGALAGVVWAAVQALCTWVVVKLDETPGFACTLDLPKTTLGVIAVLLCVSAVAAFALVLRRANRKALWALAVEVVLVLLWAVVGGWGAFDCARSL